MIKVHEKKIESAIAYRGRIVSVNEDVCELPNGKNAYREVVRHPGGVAVLPVDDSGNIVAVSQFRYPFMTELLEIPAGKLEPGEEPAACGVRELREETGYVAGELTALGETYPSPGFCDEIIYLYIARRLTAYEARPDPDEFLNVHHIPLETFLEMIAADKIRDSKTITAVMKARKYLGF